MSSSILCSCCLTSFPYSLFVDSSPCCVCQLLAAFHCIKWHPVAWMCHSLLIHLPVGGYFNFGTEERASITNTADWRMDSRNVLLSVVQAASLRSGCQRGWLRALFLVHRWHLSAASSRDRRGEGAPWDLSYEATPPIHEGSPFILITLPQPHLLTPPHGLWGSTM